MAAAILLCLMLKKTPQGRKDWEETIGQWERVKDICHGDSLRGTPKCVDDAEALVVKG